MGDQTASLQPLFPFPCGNQPGFHQKRFPSPSGTIPDSLRNHSQFSQESFLTPSGAKAPFPACLSPFVALIPSLGTDSSPSCHASSSSPSQEPPLLHPHPRCLLLFIPILLFFLLLLLPVPAQSGSSSPAAAPGMPSRIWSSPFWPQHPQSQFPPQDVVIPGVWSRDELSPFLSAP